MGRVSNRRKNADSKKKGFKKSRITKRRARDIDQIQDDLQHVKQGISKLVGEKVKFNEDLPITLIDEIKGSDLYNLVRNADKVVAFHGMMTNLASINKHKVLDLFHCNIRNWDDYRNYRNSFYEFKPSYNGYDFIIPSKNIKKTLKKIRYSLKK